MSKFDHRLKRLETRTGSKKRFDYWLILSPGKEKSPATISVDKQIQDIKAGKVPGKMGTWFDPEKKNLIIVSAIPRLRKRALKESDRARQNEISSAAPFAKTVDAVDLTDEELAAEISSIQKELAK